MKVDHQTMGNVEVLTPTAALVDEDAAAFCAELARRVDCTSPKIVVSLQDVPYLDSAALEALLDAAEELASRATSLKLANVSPTCREILELTGLASKFRLFEDVQDAVRSFV